MHRNVELLIGRLVTDPELLRRFVERPRETLLGQALELSSTELDALSRLSPESLRVLSAGLDPRIRKFSPTGHTDTTGERDPDGR